MFCAKLHAYIWHWYTEHVTNVLIQPLWGLRDRFWEVRHQEVIEQQETKFEMLYIRQNIRGGWLLKHPEQQ